MTTVVDLSKGREGPTAPVSPGFTGPTAPAAPNCYIDAPSNGNLSGFGMFVAVIVAVCFALIWSIFGVLGLSQELDHAQHGIVHHPAPASKAEMPDFDHT